MVLDTNIIFSALINKNSVIRDILVSDKILFLLPDFVLDEILKHKDLLCKKTGLSQNEVFFTLFYLLSKVHIIKKEAFSEKLEYARKAMEKIDIFDSEFLALALSIENDGIFSQDKHFDKTEIKRWSVKEVVELLKKD